MRMRQTVFLIALLLLSSMSAMFPASAQSDTDPEALLQEARSILVSDTEAGLELAQRAGSIERNSSTPRRPVLLTAAWLEGEALFRLDRLDEAAIHLAETLEANPPENSEVYGKLLVASGRVARGRGDDSTALRSFQNAFTVFSEIDSRRYMAISLQALGTLYQNARQYDRAIEYVERSTAIYPDDPMLRIASLNARAVAFRYMGREDEARALFREALNTEAAQAIPGLAVRILSNFAAFESEIGNRSGAREAVAAIDSMIEEGLLAEAPVLALAVKAELAMAAGSGGEAIELLDRAFAGVDLRTTTEESQDAHKIAYQVYSDLGSYRKAYGHLEAFKRLEDIERDIAASANAAINDAEFELSIKERENAALRSEQLETEVALIGARRRQEQMIAATVVILTLTIGAFLIWRAAQSIRVRKITERLNKELEGVNQRLRTSNVKLEKANSAKTEFLATTSHEIRTPLNAVINLTAHVIENSELDNSSYEKLSTALKSAEHLHDIVSDVLDVARFEGKRVKAHLSDVNLRSTLSDVANLWRSKAEEKKLDFIVDLNVDCATFRTDDKLLRQVLSNLISNAIKFTNNGHIELSATGGSGSPLQLKISDTGIGIPDGHRESIFDSFRQVESSATRNFGGTGLGLAICRQITELLGGKIDLESEPGVGTSFTVTLPLQGSPASSKANAAQSAEPKLDLDAGLKDLRILVAEDNAVNAMVIQAILKGKVQALTIVENGLEAVNALIDGGFDIVLMDKQMPVMDGVEAIRRIRALDSAASNTPIVAVTADAFAEARQELFDAGADDYVSKPVKPEELKRSIVTNFNKYAEDKNAFRPASAG